MAQSDKARLEEEKEILLDCIIEISQVVEPESRVVEVLERYAARITYIQGDIGEIQ